MQLRPLTPPRALGVYHSHMGTHLRPNRGRRSSMDIGNRYPQVPDTDGGEEPDVDGVRIFLGLVKTRIGSLGTNCLLLSPRGSSTE